MERRYIARVIGVRPEIIEMRTDYLVAVPRSRRAFLIMMNPMAEAVVGRGTALAVVRKARAEDVLVFGNGRCIVYVFNEAWQFHPGRRWKPASRILMGAMVVSFTWFRPSPSLFNTALICKIPCLPRV